MKEKTLITPKILLSRLGNDIVFVDESVHNFFKSEISEPCDYSYSTVKDYFCGIVKNPADTVLSWKIEGEITESSISKTEVFLSRSSSFQSDETEIYSVSGNEYSVFVTDLYAGAKYFWYVLITLNDGEIIRSETENFTTSCDQPRFIKTDNLANVRDIGGRLTYSGRRTNQGLLYRGSQLDSFVRKTVIATDYEISKFRNKFGIKTDLDLRSTVQVIIEKSPLGDDINFEVHHIGAYDHPYKTDLGKERLGNALSVLAVAENYPIYFHCIIGCDRTGTVSAMSQLSAGVKEGEVIKEYEATTFQTVNARYRNDTNVIPHCKPEDFILMMNFFKKRKGKTLREKVQYVMHRYLNMPYQRIDNIAGMLVGNEAVFTKSSLDKKKAKYGKLCVSFYMRDSKKLCCVKCRNRNLPFKARCYKGKIIKYSLDVSMLKKGNYTAKFIFDDAERRFEFSV